jgi:hypothetical protein
MNYIASLLIIFCNDINAQVQSPAFVPACMAATKSAAMQSGVGQSVDTFVDQQQKYYQPKVIDMTGEKPWVVGAGLYMVYSKKITIATSVKPFVDQLKIEAAPDSQTLSLVWNF